MKPTIRACLLLAVLNFVQSLSILNNGKWDTNAKNFANQSRAYIREKYEPTNFICSNLREHIVLFEENQVLTAFHSCDRPSTPESRQDCYYKAENYFHMRVNRAREANACTVENSCSFWINDVLKWNGPPSSCLYFESINSLIEIQSRCSFMAPILDVSHRLNGHVSHQNYCIDKTDDNMKRTVRQAWQDFETCKNKFQVSDDKSTELTHRCFQMWQIQEIFSNMTQCYKKPLENFRKSIDMEQKNSLNCGKKV